MKRVVVTGIGMITALGNNAEETWGNMKKGKNGIGPITHFDASRNKVQIAAEAKIDISEHIPHSEARKMDRFTQLTVIAAEEAFRDSGISEENADFTRCGTIIASGIGGISTITSEHVKSLEKGHERVSPFFAPSSLVNIAAAQVAINTGFKGYCVAPVTACAAGSNAIGDAMHKIRHGYMDVALCGGSEAGIIPLTMGGFVSMKAVNTSNDANRASIPFDKERSGFVMGEGSGILVLEELEHAKRRGAKIYAEVVGYGTSCDAYHIVAPSVGGVGGEAAMRMAIDDAGLSAEDIDYINAHGTSTPLNDKSEAAAINRIFDRKVPVSSTKSMIGHTMGAAGALEGIISVLALGDGFIPPTINYEVPDEECELDVVPNQGRDADLKYVMSNSFGFGGHNASLVFGRV
jgi:3-oxoacyl-[acyl-carrier-protein] synthase II